LAKCSPRALLATSHNIGNRKKKKKEKRKNCLFTVGLVSSFEINPLNIKIDYFENTGVR
jgi:hypothetical protein